MSYDFGEIEFEKRPQIAGLLFAASALPIGVAFFADGVLQAVALTVGGIFWLLGLMAFLPWLWEELDLQSQWKRLAEPYLQWRYGRKVDLFTGNVAPEWECPYCDVPGQTLHVIGHECPQCGAALDQDRERARRPRE